MRSALVAIAVAASVLPAHAADSPSLRVPYERYRLANGLTVILHEDHSLPLVAVNLWFRVGSKEEPPRRTGFAHLFEHLMFMGTKNVPDGKFDEILEGEGAQNNASTSSDYTEYHELGPSHLLETFLWLEADRLATLPEAMTEKKVALQREVVRNERRQSSENRPYGRVELVLPELLYPPGHPYRHPVIGSHADLVAARVADVKAFFRSYYVPSNASLVIAGDFKPGEARRLVDKWFGWLPRASEPAHAWAAPPRLTKNARALIDDAVELDGVTMAWHAPPAPGPGSAENDVLAALLGGGRGSRLVKRLVYERKLASEIEARVDEGLLGSQLSIVAICAPGHRAAELEAAIRDELKALLSTAPPTEREVARARAYVETRRLERLDSPLEIALALNEWEHRLGDPGALERLDLARYAKVGPSDVAWAAWATLGQPDATVVVRARGARGGGKSATVEASRAK
jgi:predicted Zn-dependent peptidase